MKITYEFVTGEISEVEVDERLGGMLLDLDRQQEKYGAAKLSAVKPEDYPALMQEAQVL